MSKRLLEIWSTALLSFFPLPFECHEITKLLIVNRMVFYPGLNSIGFPLGKARIIHPNHQFWQIQTVEFFRGCTFKTRSQIRFVAAPSHPFPIHQAAIYWSSLDTLTEARFVTSNCFYGLLMLPFPGKHAGLVQMMFLFNQVIFRFHPLIFWGVWFEFVQYQFDVTWTLTHGSPENDSLEKIISFGSHHFQVKWYALVVQSF